MALASAVSAGNGYCMDGRQFYCCPVPAALDGGINCGWKDKCDDGQTLLTFAGNFEGDADTSTLKGLRGQALSDALAKLPSLAGEQQYCCGNEEVENWKDWYVNLVFAFPPLCCQGFGDARTLSPMME